MSEKIVDIQTLVQDDHNFNKGTEAGRQLMERSFSELGAGRSILVDKDGRIIAGNKSQKAAIAAGIKKVRIIETTGDELVAVKRTDISLDSKEGRELALADNLTTQVNLEWDKVELQEVAAQQGIDLPDWGLDPQALGIDEQPAEPQEAQEDEFDEEKDAIEKRAERGDIWQLGAHRLLCGDSLSEECVNALLDGEYAPLTFTDPPYRLATQGGGVLKTANSMKQIKDNGVDEFEPLKLKLYSKTNIYSHNKPLIKDYILLSEREGKAYDLAIYKKQGLPNYKGHLMTDIEYIAIIGDQDPRKGFDFEMYSKVFVGNKDKDNDLSYSKPIALCAKFIQLYSDKGDIVLDLFGGSGSTLIACEQLGRRCYAMELDPHYCDVIIARWEKLTGLKAQRL